MGGARMIRLIGGVGLVIAVSSGLSAVVAPASAQEGVDVSARLSVAMSAPYFDRRTGTYDLTVRIRNTSAAPVYAPLALVVTSVDTGMTLANASWWTARGAPMVDVFAPHGVLGPRRETRVVLEFADTTGSPPPRNRAQYRRFSFRYVVLGLPAPRPPELPVGVEVRLSEPAIAPGDAVGIAWRLTGGAPPKTGRVQVRAQGPGLTATAAGPGWSSPGLAPPMGAVSYLTSAGAWTTAPAMYLPRRRPATPPPTRAGHVSVPLPAATTGAWGIEVAVVDEADGAVLATARATVVVSGEPALYLRLSRPIANSLDPVRATLVTTAGTTPRPVRLLAWLTGPDGSQVGLPGMTPGRVEVYAGDARDDRIRLLDHFFGSEGQGAYQVHARLFDRATGALLGRASAGFEVCDAPRSMSGVVRSAGGVPLGDGARLATVNALDLDDGAVTATAPIDATGTYALVLAPGRYRLRALVIDANGVHRAEPVGLVETGCAGGATTLDLAAGPPVPGSLAGP